MTGRRTSVFWAVVVAASLVFIGYRQTRGPMVDTSLLSLLPAAEGDPLLVQANALMSQRASYLLALLVGAPDPALTDVIDSDLKKSLRASGVVRHFLTDVSPDQQKAFYDLYFPYRYQMLSPRDRESLGQGQAMESFTRRLAEGLYSPASSFLKGIVGTDPLLLFPALARSWGDAVPPMGLLNPGDGRTYALTAVELSVDPFDSKNQDRVMAWVNQWRREFQKGWPDARFYVSGVLPFASAERIRTEREMTWASVGSLVVVILLTLWIFSSVRVLATAALPIGVGFVMASAATILVFGKIHMITLAFGSSLIGVAVDYPILYLACYRMAGEKWNASEALTSILPSLGLGAGTTLLGYAALSLAPFPGLQQMALFSSVGLAAALVTVVVSSLGPSLLTSSMEFKAEPALLRWGRTYLTFLRRLWTLLSRKTAAAVWVGLLLFIGVGLVRVRFNDDIGLLQRPSAALAEEDAFVRKGTGGMGASRFILIRGHQLEELLQRQEQLQDKLRSLLKAGAITSIQSLAPFLPSLEQQTRDRDRLRSTFGSNASRLRQHLSRLGLASEVAERLLKDLQRPLTPFSVDAWLESPASELLRSLWIGPTAQGVASVALVGGLNDPHLLQDALKGLEGVQFFDQMTAYTQLFRRYRLLSLGLMVAAYIAVWGLMMGRYGMRLGSLVTLPSIGAVLFTFAVLGWLQVPVHLIHCLSSLLVLSMGVDYTIYFVESLRREGLSSPTLLAVALCAACALSSFGFLALCRTPVLSAVGCTVSLGMAIALLLAPLPYIVQREAP